jgi:uncharacterized membrane protein (UPF0127 family)
MKKIFALFISLIFLSLPSLAEPLQIQTSTQTLVFDVEIADTEETRAMGLMNRPSLAPNSGMLFIFDVLSLPEFWMKDTKISLDMIYIGEDGVIDGIHENAIPYDETPISPPAPALAVLEIAGGSSKTLGIAKGDKVIHQIFEKDLKSK